MDQEVNNVSKVNTNWTFTQLQKGLAAVQRITVFMYAIDVPDFYKRVPTVLDFAGVVRMAKCFNTGQVDTRIDRLAPLQDDELKFAKRNWGADQLFSEAWHNTNVNNALIILVNDPKTYAAKYKRLWVARDTNEADKRAIAIIDRRRMSADKYLSILDKALDRAGQIPIDIVKNLSEVGGVEIKPEVANEAQSADD